MWGQVPTNAAGRETLVTSPLRPCRHQAPKINQNPGANLWPAPRITPDYRGNAHVPPSADDEVSVNEARFA